MLHPRRLCTALVLCLLFAAACSDPAPNDAASPDTASRDTAPRNAVSQNAASPDTTPSARAPVPRRDTIRSLSDAFQSIGVLQLEIRRIVYSTHDSSDVDDWTIRNADGSVFAVIDAARNQFRIGGDTLRLDHLSNGSAQLDRHPFAPLMLAPAYGVVNFEVARATPEAYHVVVQDPAVVGRGLVKQIDRSAPGLAYVPWAEYVPGTYPVLTDEPGAPIQLPFRAGPSKAAEPIQPPAVLLSPFNCAQSIAEVDGAWMRLECKPGCTAVDSLQGRSLGWTRWHRDGRVLITDLRTHC